MLATRRALLLGGLAVAGAAALAPRSRARAALGAPRRLIVVFVSGGWDVTYALDPKPGVAGVDAPAGQIQSFGDLPIFTDLSRPQVAEYFAAHAGITTLINGLQVASIAHQECSTACSPAPTTPPPPTSPPSPPRSTDSSSPRPYLVLGRTAFSGPFGALSARTGSANQIVTLLDPKSGLPPIGGPLLPLVPTDAESALIREHVLASAQAQLAARPNQRLSDFASSLGRADALREIGKIGEIELARTFEAQAELAVEALARGLCHSVQMESDGWDTHEGNDQQGPLHDQLFAGLRGLVDALAARPGAAAGSKLLDETAVLVVSEFSRTPRLNGAMGKDHWPVTSAMLIGGGLPGGRLLGGTHGALEAAGIDLQSGAVDQGAAPLAYGNFAAGVLQAIGVDPAPYLPNEPFHALLG
jgi:hypothetical protein